MQSALSSNVAGLSPEELLILANAHEGQEIERYRQMALRFLPYDRGVGRLMEMLVLESEQRLTVLTSLNEQLGFPALSRPRKGRESVCGIHPFFIVNAQGATQAIQLVLAGERHSLRLYQQLQEASAMPRLTALLGLFIEQKHTQQEVLEEYLSHL